MKTMFFLCSLACVVTFAVSCRAPAPTKVSIARVLEHPGSCLGSTLFTDAVVILKTRTGIAVYVGPYPLRSLARTECCADKLLAVHFRSADRDRVQVGDVIEIAGQLGEETSSAGRRYYLNANQFTIIAGEDRQHRTFIALEQVAQHLPVNH